MSRLGTCRRIVPPIPCPGPGGRGWSKAKPREVIPLQVLGLSVRAALAAGLLWTVCFPLLAATPNAGQARLGEIKIEGALDQTTECEFVEVPLDAAVAVLARNHAIPVVLDRRALRDAMLEPDTPLSFSIRGVTLQSALNLMLRPLDLTWTISDEVLLITTPEAAERYLITRFYAVGELVRQDRPDSRPSDYDCLIELIASTIEPQSWVDMGGPGGIVALTAGGKPMPVITHTARVQREVSCLLRSLAAPDGRAKDDKVLAAEARIEQALEQTTECNFSKTPLRDAVRFLSQSHGIPILIDERALADAMVEPTVPVTFSIRGVTLASALNLMLRPPNLAWTISDEMLLVTTPEKTEQLLITRVYPVGDLVGSASERQAGFDALLETITASVEPQTWADMGGPGSIAPADVAKGPMLVVSHTAAVHRRIGALLKSLREAVSADGAISFPRGYELPFPQGFGPIPGGNSDAPEGSAPPTGGGMF